jgi:hypothetical protein
LGSDKSVDVSPKFNDCLEIVSSSDGNIFNLPDGGETHFTGQDAEDARAIAFRESRGPESSGFTLLAELL